MSKREFILSKNDEEISEDFAGSKTEFQGGRRKDKKSRKYSEKESSQTGTPEEWSGVSGEKISVSEDFLEVKKLLETPGDILTESDINQIDMFLRQLKDGVFIDKFYEDLKRENITEKELRKQLELKKTDVEPVNLEQEIADELNKEFPAQDIHQIGKEKIEDNYKIGKDVFIKNPTLTKQEFIEEFQDKLGTEINNNNKDKIYKLADGVFSRLVKEKMIEMPEWGKEDKVWVASDKLLEKILKINLKTSGLETTKVKSEDNKEYAITDEIPSVEKKAISSNILGSNSDNQEDSEENSIELSSEDLDLSDFNDIDTKSTEKNNEKETDIKDLHKIKEDFRLLLNVAKLSKLYQGQANENIDNKIIVEQAGYAESENIRNSTELNNPLQKMRDLLITDKEINQEELKKIIDKISEKTALSVEEIEDIFNVQQELLKRKATRDVISEKSFSQRIKGSIGKIAGYMGVGAVLTATTVGTGGWAILGAGSFGALRVLDRLRIGKKQQKEVEKELDILKGLIRENDEEKNGMHNNIIADLATRIQRMINSGDKKEGDENAESQIKEYVETVGYYLDKNDNFENKEEIKELCGVLGRIDQSNARLEDIITKKKPGIFSRIGEKTNKWFGQDVANRQAGNATIFVGMGWLAREVPGLRNLLTGYAGMKLGDLAIKGLSRDKQEKIITPKELHESGDPDILYEANTQLANPEFREKNPTLYNQLREEVARKEEEHIEYFIDKLQERNDFIEGELKGKRLEKRRNKVVGGSIRGLIRFGGFVAGFITPELLKAIAVWAEDRLESHGAGVEHVNAQEEGQGAEESLAKGGQSEIASPEIAHEPTFDAGARQEDYQLGGRQSGYHSPEPVVPASADVLAGERKPVFETLKVERSWMDNDTPRNFDANEKFFKLGGYHGTGFTKAGDVELDISKMTSGGSFHGNTKVDVPAELKNIDADGHAQSLKMLISLHGKDEAIEVPINSEGKIVIEHDSPLRELFEQDKNGQLVFKGEYMEVAKVGETADGVTKVDVLATNVGKGTVEQGEVDKLFEQVTSNKVQVTIDDGEQGTNNNSEASGQGINNNEPTASSGGDETGQARGNVGNETAFADASASQGEFTPNNHEVFGFNSQKELNTAIDNGMVAEVNTIAGHDLPDNQHLFKVDDKYVLVGVKDSNEQFVINNSVHGIDDAVAISAVENLNTELTANHISVEQAQEVLTLAENAGVDFSKAAEHFKLLDKDFYNEDMKTTLLQIVEDKVKANEGLKGINSELGKIVSVTETRSGLMFKYEDGLKVNIIDGKAALTLKDGSSGGIMRDISSMKPEQTEKMLVNPEEFFKNRVEETATPTPTPTAVETPTEANNNINESITTTEKIDSSGIFSGSKEYADRVDISINNKDTSLETKIYEYKNETGNSLYRVDINKENVKILEYQHDKATGDIKIYDVKEGDKILNDPEGYIKSHQVTTVEPTQTPKPEEIVTPTPEVPVREKLFNYDTLTETEQNALRNLFDKDVSNDQEALEALVGDTKGYSVEKVGDDEIKVICQQGTKELSAIITPKQISFQEGGNDIKLDIKDMHPEELSNILKENIKPSFSMQI